MGASGRHLALQAQGDRPRHRRRHGAEERPLKSICASPGHNMVKFASIIPALAIGALGLPSAAAAASGDEARIRALEAQFVAAFKAKDIDAIMKVYVPSDSLVAFDVVPPRQFVGAQAYRKDWEAQLAKIKGPLKVELN